MRQLTFALLLVAALGLGCTNRQKTVGDAATASGEDSTSESSSRRLERVPPRDGGPELAAQASDERADAESTQSAASLPLGKPVPGLKGLLVPPATPGRAQVALDGCLAQAEVTEEVGARFPAPAPTRGPAAATVTVDSLGGGVLVVHELVHGCCLRAEVKSSLKDRTLTLTEVLSGQSCRCRCASTVRAAVGLPPGDYTLRVVTEEPGKRRFVHEAPLAVQ